ncbi:MAG: co-chaperone GroES [Actinobacteria bacterium]|nr:co-chaperone GroES [Actinomycetota bacterium]
MASFEPAIGRVLIHPFEADSVTEGGIILPETSQEETEKAKIAAISVGQFIDGKLVKTDYKVGDTILFSKYAGTEIKIGEKVLKIISFVDILGRMAA